MNSNTNNPTREWYAEDACFLYLKATILMILAKFANILGGDPSNPSVEMEEFRDHIGRWEPCVISALFNFVSKLGGAANEKYGSGPMWKLLVCIGDTMETINLQAHNHYRVNIDGTTFTVEDYSLDETLKTGIDTRKIALVPEDGFMNLRWNQTAYSTMTASDPDGLLAAIKRFAKLAKSTNALQIVQLEKPMIKVDGFNAAAETYLMGNKFVGLNALSEMASAVALRYDWTQFCGADAVVYEEDVWVRKFLVPTN